MQLETYRPRQSRGAQRGAAAFLAAKANGASAMEAAVAQIDAEFDDAAAVNSFKCRVENMIRVGTGHRDVQMRYGEWAREIASRPAVAGDVDAAINFIEHRYRAQRHAFQIASALGRGSRHSVEVLRELRLILRLIRRSEYREHFGAIIELVSGR